MKNGWMIAHAKRKEQSAERKAQSRAVEQGRERDLMGALGWVAGELLGEWSAERKTHGL